MGELGIMERGRGGRAVQSFVGLALAGAAFPLANLAREVWQQTVILAASLLGVVLAYRALFTRFLIVIDPRSGLFVESRRALFRPRKDVVRSFDEIAFVGLDYFHERTFEDGEFKGQELRANAWVQWIDGELRSFGSGSPAEVASLADGLRRLTRAPFRMRPAEQTPSSDRWTLSSSE